MHYRVQNGAGDGAARDVEPHSRCQHFSAHYLHSHIGLVLKMLPWILALACVTLCQSGSQPNTMVLIHHSKVDLRDEELKLF